MKVDKNIYKKLAKIKKPVMIWVEDSLEAAWADRPSYYSRLRILYPTGVCKYATPCESSYPRNSCFVPAKRKRTLKTTSEAMRTYDEKDEFLVITAVEYL